jgi:hypothetical protein
VALLLNSSNESCFDSNEVRNVLILAYIRHFHCSLFLPVFCHHDLYVDL